MKKTKPSSHQLRLFTKKGRNINQNNIVPSPQNDDKQNNTFFSNKTDYKIYDISIIEDKRRNELYDNLLSLSDHLNSI